MVATHYRYLLFLTINNDLATRRSQLGENPAPSGRLTQWGAVTWIFSFQLVKGWGHAHKAER